MWFMRRGSSGRLGHGKHGLRPPGVADLVGSKDAQQLYAGWVDETWALGLGRLVDACGLTFEPGQALRTATQSLCTLSAKAGSSLLAIQAACDPTEASKKRTGPRRKMRKNRVGETLPSPA